MDCSLLRRLCIVHRNMALPVNKQNCGKNREALCLQWWKIRWKIAHQVIFVHPLCLQLSCDVVQTAGSVHTYKTGSVEKYNIRVHYSKNGRLGTLYISSSCYNIIVVYIGNKQAHIQVLQVEPPLPTHVYEPWFCFVIIDVVNTSPGQHNLVHSGQEFVVVSINLCPALKVHLQGAIIDTSFYLL